MEQKQNIIMASTIKTERIIFCEFGFNANEVKLVTHLKN